jgi:hypothetical protein
MYQSVYERIRSILGQGRRARLLTFVLESVIAGKIRRVGRQEVRNEYARIQRGSCSLQDE